MNTLTSGAPGIEIECSSWKPIRSPVDVVVIPVDSSVFRTAKSLQLLSTSPRIVPAQSSLSIFPLRLGAREELTRDRRRSLSARRSSYTTTSSNCFTRTHSVESTMPLL
ncbi:hypothetical protein PC115_g8654 [Phytophthora cactorum]|uniref:Uncharacterized protein n=1 Tax=Phytophthora cactorum TaxID=29920 RepID=A0A8T1CPL5_9STRA|nr:hypothetical protein PC115_g8654 [Phytophthora cactorum]